MSPEEKLRRLQAALELANHDTLSSTDIAEIVRVLLAVIAGVKQDGDQSVTSARKAADAAVKRMDENVRESFGDATRDIENVRKLANRALLWINEQGKKTTEDDATRALELGHDNEDAIVRLAGRLEELKRQPGPAGKAGKPPAHRWKGSVLFFQNPDGTWDDGVDLRGEPGAGGGPIFGWGAGISQNLRPGSPNVHINNDVITVDENSGGTSLSIEVPPETPDDSNVVYTFTQKPFQIVMNSSSYREGKGWTWNTGPGTATMFSPVGLGGDIYGVIQS